MATALQLPTPDTGPAFNDLSAGLVPHAHTTDYANGLSFDLRDNRYPTLSTSPASRSSASKRNIPPSERTMSSNAWRDSWVADPMSQSPVARTPEKLTEEPAVLEGRPPQDTSPAPCQQAQTHRPEDTPPYTVPSRGSPRAADRYHPEDQPRRIPSRDLSDNLVRAGPEASPQGQEMGQRSSGVRQSPVQAGSLLPSTPRHPSLPAAGIGAGPSSPIVPLSAGPSYNPSNMQIPISPKPRAYAQHPTYITPSSGPNSMNPTYAPPQLPKEEVCVECAMRDQDMADVDVTSPGVWERESDVLYEELLHREQEEEATGVHPPETPTRPRATGGPLSEENLRVWQSMNPKEPSSRQQTLDQYVRSQRTLLEAEALAHARAMRESQQLDNRMRDTYSQLRRSAYELGSTAQLTDDVAGVRIKPPRSASMPSAAMMATHGYTHGREVTLLENGMIVEHVDVRREEKEVRERRRREEKRERSRARKSSRGSAIDVASVYSMPLPSQLLQTDSGFFSGVKGSDSRYSQSFSLRPSSVLTTAGERPLTLPRAYSQASFSDMQSVGSASSPRRSRFFGFKNIASGWRSSDSLAPSGSMMDMHVALQREQQYLQTHPIQDQGSSVPTLRGRESWPAGSLPPELAAASAVEAPKKKNGLKKIWKIVTGSASKNGARMKGRIQSRSLDRAEDDLPLAPPPPLSYLVDRERGIAARRHVSTPSLPSSASPNALSPHAPSPPTAPSSLVPSPTSSRQPGAEKENWADGRSATDQDHQIPSSDANPHEFDARGRATQSSSKTMSSLSGPLTPITLPSNRPQSATLRRDKSLPPLPGESSIEFPDHPMPDGRPQTMYTYNLQQMSSSGDASGYLLPPQAPFRTGDGRRQSFGGIASQPHPAVQSLPLKLPYARGAANVPPFLAEERYGEFGVSRLSLNQWDGTRSTARNLQAPSKPKNRRSKFGLSSLFGKKSSTDSKEAATGTLDIPEYASGTFRTSASGDEGLMTSNGYSGPGSAHSSGQRMSVTSRKNIAELVDQDPEFVAYRYPSGDQRFDLLR
ncbi:hypothetical protein B0H21DRAFT_374340 [Amylocystis lapponica]|nr:hypothetical protein B0H21DRAFT_374340 [Amylocystis lapponica]